MRSQFHIRSLLVPLSTLAFLAAQLIAPSPVWKALLAAFGGVWLLTYLWARSLSRNVRFERAMRFGWAQVGDVLEEQFAVHNEGFLPATWLEISDHSTLPGYTIARATGVDGWSRNSWQTSGVCTRRGVFTLGDTTLITGDPLGIYQVELSQAGTATLTVMPPVVPLPFLETTAGGWQGEGRPHRHSRADTVSAETVRAYRPGDSMRWIHWPTTAHRNQPYVRVLEGAPTSDWWIALDFERGVQAGTESTESTLELGVILAASVAERGLRLHRSVGLIAAGQRPIWMRPDSGERQSWELMRALALIDAGETPLAALLERVGPTLGRQASLFVITPSMESAWVDAVTRLTRRGIIATAILIDPATFGARSSVDALAQLLSDAGIAHHVLGRELFRQEALRPGSSGQWEWRVLPTGKAVPVRRPADLSWKNLR
ncbi:MAG TPA: DUF58 domain-containing protein [Anaerolineales bacterium]